MRPRAHCQQLSSLHTFSLDHFLHCHGFHIYADKFYICISISQHLSELKLHFCAHVPMVCKGLNSIFASPQCKTNPTSCVLATRSIGRRLIRISILLREIKLLCQFWENWKGMGCSGEKGKKGITAITKA